MRNQGDADSVDVTELRYYRSVGSRISTSDTEVGRIFVDRLRVAGSSDAPPDPGLYFHGACVDAVSRESDTTNNCSSAVRVTLPEP